MKFIHQRLFHTVGNAAGDFTCSHITNRKNFDSFALEDTYHPEKIAGKTRIPGGFLYELELQKADTPLTIKHRETYAKHPDGLWFKENPGWYHIEITGIDNYKGVYLHTGVDDSHTLGCVLPCFGFDLKEKDNQGKKSMQATNLLYSIVYPLLVKGERCFWEVRDEIML